MKRSVEPIFIVLFCILIAAPGVIGLLLPDRVFSESENRNLSGKPTLSVDAVFSGDYMKGFENYVTDQFVLRDKWVAVKTASELALLKKANNSVEPAGGRLIKYVEEPKKEDIDKKIAAISAFAENVDAEVNFALIPSAACIYKNELSKGAPTADEEEWISYCYENADVENIDILSALAAHKDEYIYYRTDHHYTSLGAGIAAEAVFEKLEKGYEFNLGAYEPVLVSDSFLGTGRNSFGADMVKADEIYRYTDGTDVTVYKKEKGKLNEGCLYNEEALLHNNQYPYFLGGNTPLCIIKSQAAGGKILLVRDSFSDSLAPFLAEYYGEIHLADLRYYKESIKDYIKENEIKKVLIIYSFPDFVSDSGIRLLNR